MSPERPLPGGGTASAAREREEGAGGARGSGATPRSSPPFSLAMESADESLPSETASLQELVARYERRLIEAALARTRGNRARAAKLLNTTERILGYRVQRYGIDCSLYRG